MPLLTAIASPIVPAPPVSVGFNTAFFRPYRPEPQADSGSGDTIGAREPRTAYSADLHGSHEDFCRSPDFSVYQQQMRENVDFLAEFCRRNGMPEADGIAERFDVFYRHRFTEPYFDTHSELVDSIGKQVLDRFCDLVRDHRIPLEARKAAVQDLSEGVVLCASGTVSNLIGAERELSMSSGGISATLWKTKEALVRHVLREAVAERFGYMPLIHRQNEIHYVNAVWNYIADPLGLTQIPDLMAPVLDDAKFLHACLARVRAAMTPDRIAVFVAEEQLASFSAQVARNAEQLSGECTAAMAERFREVVELIRHELGLDESSLGLHAFVRLSDDGATYRIRTDASLVAREVLKAMHARGLLSDGPIAWGEWRDEHDQRAALFSYGEGLAWRAQPSGDALMPVGTSAWNPYEDADLITVSDLLAWSQAQGGDAKMPPRAAIGQVVRCSDPAELVDMAAEWIDTAASALELFARWDDERLGRYLQANLSYFANRFPVDERAAMIDEVMSMRQAASILVPAWYANPWILMTQVSGGEGKSRLQQWMARNNARAIDTMAEMVSGIPPISDPQGTLSATIYLALRGREAMPALHEAMAANHDEAIDAWHRLVSAAASDDQVARQLSGLLWAAMEGTPALAVAMRKGNARAIEAIHRLMVDPLLVPRLQGDLPELVAGICPDGASALWLALKEGNVSAIEAYGGLLIDSAITPHVEKDLPELLLAMDADGIPGLWSALASGHAEAIGVYHAVLVHPVMRPHIQPILPALLRGEGPGAVSGLLLAAEEGHSAAITACHALIADPCIVETVGPVLPDLLAAKSSRGTPALAWAMLDGDASVIKAFHAMFADPALLPYIRHALPELVAAWWPNGTPGLALALQNGQVAAIQAFHAMSADPAILPHIRHTLVPLFAANARYGMWGSKGGMRTPSAEAVDAFNAMLADPAIVQYVGDMSEFMLLDGVSPSTPEPADDEPSSVSDLRDARGRARVRNGARRLLRWLIGS